MGELPDERMREAVEAALQAWEQTSVPDEAPIHVEERVAMQAAIEAALPFLSAPPSQLPAGRRYELWICDECGDHAECGPGEKCEVCCDGTVQRVECVPLELVDSRPSLDLTAPQIGSLLGALQFSVDSGAPDQPEIEAALRAELARAGMDQ